MTKAVGWVERSETHRFSQRAPENAFGAKTLTHSIHLPIASSPLFDGFRFAPPILRALVSIALAIVCETSFGHLAFAELPIPIVNCEGDSTPHPLPIPTNYQIRVHVPNVLAKKLAYYTYGFDAVLAPRGWICTDTSRDSTSGTQLVVHPKGAESSTFGVYSKWITNSTMGDQGYIYNWASVYFPKFAPREYQIEPGIIRKKDGDTRIFRYSSDTLKYDSQFLVEYVTPSDTKGIGSAIVLYPNDSKERYLVQKAPVRGFIAIGNSDEALACTVFLYAEELPPQDLPFASYMTSENEAVVDNLINLGQSC